MAKAPSNRSGSRAGNTRSNKKNQNNQLVRHEFLGALMAGVTLIFVIILLSNANEYHAFYTVKQFFKGLFGSMLWSAPIYTALTSYLIFSAKGDKQTTVKTTLTALSLYICLLTIVEAFSVEAIQKEMKYDSYINFISFAFSKRIGGGVIGAFLAWPFYRFMGKLGVVLISLILIGLILFASGILSIERMMDKIGEMKTANPQDDRNKKTLIPKREERPARENIPVRRTPASRKDVFDVPPKTPARTSPRSSSSIYNEPILDNYGVNTRAPVRLPNLMENAKEPDRTPISRQKGAFEVPTVSGAKTSYKDPFENAAPKKPAAKTASQKAKGKKPSEKDVSIEKIDLMEAVRMESDEERNRKYVKSALSDHSKAPKPVLGYSVPSQKGKKETTERTQKAEMPVSSDYSEKYVPEIQEKPRKAESETYVKPAPKAEPASVKEPVYEAPAPKKAPQEPKPSFFEPTTEVKKENYVPKTRLAGMKEDVPGDEYDFPPIDLMETSGYVAPTDGYDPGDMQRAELLVQTLQSFSIPVKITGISHGPAVTRFELLPAPGIKVSKITQYADDIAMNLAAETVRIEAPIPGRSAVGVELPNLKKEVVHLRDVLESNEARKAASRLAVALGKDNSGKMIVADLASMPHVLIAGQTGSGKSVCINAIVISILFRATPEEVRMIMIDPKMVELNVYNSIPHLLVPVVTDPKKAASALDWAVSEMTRRYKEFAARGAKNIQSYNKKLQDGEKPMPQIVIIVDELADLMMTAPHDVEEAINRLAQLARAAGMHLVIATQRPSVNVITGVIKANIPTRIAFTVASGVDSRTILDSYGAEALLGRGDMLYLPPDRNKPMRIQGAWVSEDEVQNVVNYISSVHDTNFDEDIISHMENAVMSDAEKSDKAQEDADNTVDDLFPVAVRAVMDAGQASISMLQRKLRVGYARAGRLIDEMAARGLVSQSEGSKSREVLITREQYIELFGEDDYM